MKFAKISCKLQYFIFKWVIIVLINIFFFLSAPSPWLSRLLFSSGCFGFLTLSIWVHRDVWFFIISSLQLASSSLPSVSLVVWHFPLLLILASLLGHSRCSIWLIVPEDLPYSPFSVCLLPSLSEIRVAMIPCVLNHFDLPSFMFTVLKVYSLAKQVVNLMN